MWGVDNPESAHYVDGFIKGKADGRERQMQRRFCRVVSRVTMVLERQFYVFEQLLAQTLEDGEEKGLLLLLLLGYLSLDRSFCALLQSRVHDQVCQLLYMRAEENKERDAVCEHI